MTDGNDDGGRGWLLWASLPTVLILGVSLLCAVTAGLAGSADRETPAMQASSSSPSPSLSATPEDLVKQKADRFLAQVKTVLGDQVTALLRNDEEAFLRPAKDPAIRGKLLLRYRNLVALKVSRITMNVHYLSVDPTPGRWQAPTVVPFCFVLPDCMVDEVEEPSVWAETPDGPELVSIGPAIPNPKKWFGNPQPWELTELVVAHGNRVLVAAPKSLAGRLPAGDTWSAG